MSGAAASRNSDGIEIFQSGEWNMNRIYRLVWNHALHQPQVTSELARTVPGNRNGSSVPVRGPRYRLLVLACAMALGVTGLPLSASAQSIPGSAGGAGGNGYAGQGGTGNGRGGGGGTGVQGANNNGSPSSSGTGGAGGHSGYGLGAGGAGGGVGATTIGSASIHGGDGINGEADPSAAYASGGGGGGGDGVYSSDSVLSLGAGLSIIGGDGGSGAEGDRIGGGGGGGGTGLVTAAAAAAITNAGSITGGHAGHGSSGVSSDGLGGGGGGGGDGLLMLGGGATFSNIGSVVGGDGGAAGGGTYAGGVGAGGMAVDVASDGNAIVNAGVLAGGMAGDGVTRANAVQISGAQNTLELRAGSIITGNVVSSGADNTLSLGGDVSDATTTIDASTYCGFASYQKTGASDWTLTGSGSASQNWTISAGTLTGDSHSIVGNVVDNAALVFDQADNGSYSGTLSGSGTLTKNGSGMLTFTGNNTYSGGTTLNAGTLNISSDGNLGNAAGALTMTGATLQAGASFVSVRSIAVTGDNTIDTNGFNVTLGGPISAGVNDASYNLLNKSGSGTLTLAGANTYYSATAISAGTLALAGVGAIGTGSLNVAAGTTFDISQTQSGASINTFGGDGTIALGARTLTIGLGASNSYFNGSIVDGGIAGGTGGRVVIVGSQGVVDFSGATSYTGGTTITAGTLALVDGGALDAAGAMTVDAAGTFDLAGINAASTSIGDLAGSGDVSLGAKSLTLGSANDTIFAGVVAGSGGALVKQGNGTLVLDGINTYTGGTTVAAGTLLVGDGAHSGAAVAGDVVVDSGATLGGHGSIGGNVDVLAGAHLAPGGSIGTLSMGGNASFAQGSVLDFEFGAPGADSSSFGVGDSVHVGGDLSLAGAVLNISDTGGFGPGLYNLFTYGGTLSESNDGIVFGGTPGGSYSLQNLTTQKQINLINTSGLTLNFWNANGLATAIQMGGGDGSWSTTSPNWTDASGSVTAAMRPQPGFAIFGGAAGSVTIDNSAGKLSATGLQFASDGYVMSGDALTLVGSNGAAPMIRVGDGSSAGANWTATIDNVIAGSDGLVKSDLGTLVLTGANTYSGGTTITAGTLQGDTTSLQGNITDNATLVFNQNTDGTFAGSVSGSGSVTKVGSGVLTLTGTNNYSGGTTISSGILQGDTSSLQGSIADNAALVFDQPADGIFAGSISGAGNLTKNGGGTLTFSGDSHTYSGHVEVSAGGLAVDGTLGGMLVMDAGTRLSGSGTLGSLDLAGTLAPGHSIGTLSASGDVVIRSGASYEVETDAAGHSDLLAVAGQATLQGGSVLNLAQDGSYAAHTTYTILTAGSGVDGRFDSVTSSLAFLDPELVYQPNAVQLTLTRNEVDFCAVAITANQCATGTAVQEQGGGPLNDALVTQDAATARAALGQWSGESLASTRSALLEGSRFVREAMNDRLHRADTAQDTGRSLGETAGSVWVHGWDHSGHADSDGNASKSQSSGSGLLLGVDAPLGDHLRAGVTAGQGQDALQVDALNSSARMKSDHLGLYAGSTWDAWTLDGGVAESWHDIHSTRHVDAVLPDTLHADYHGRTRQAYIEGGYRIATAHGSLQPFVNLAHVAARTGNVNEYGGITALRSEGETTEVSFGTIGVHGLWSLSGNAATSIYATLGWRHAVGDLVPLAQQHFADGERFTVSGVPLVANAAVVQVGVDFALSSHSSLRAGYDGVLAGSESDHAVRMTWQVTF
jgi:outer membrane autotransporter protein